MRESKDRDWSDVLRDRVRDVDTPPSDSLWQDIESGLDEMAYLTPRRDNTWRWIGGMAAAAAVLLAILLFDEPATVEEVMPIIENRAEVVDDVDMDVITPPEKDIVSEVEYIVEREVVIAQDIPRSGGEEVVTESVKIDVKEDAKEETKGSPQRERESVDTYDRGGYRAVVGADRKKAVNKTKLSISGSGAMASSDTSPHLAQAAAYDVLIDSERYKDNVYDIYDRSDISHHLPLSVGVRLQRGLSSRLSVVSGLNYTRLVSDITFGTDVSERQSIHFVGVPIRLDYSIFKTGNFSLYAGAGGAVEYCVGAKVADIKIDEKEFHYSTNVVLGAEYKVNSWLGLYFEPEMSYYLTKTRLNSIRNDSPATFNMCLGLSFALK